MKLLSEGGENLGMLMRDETDWDDPTMGINGEILISPLPSNLEVSIPPSDEENDLAMPNLSTESGLAGVGFFLAGFSDVGRGVNDILSGFATSLTGNSSSSESFSVGIELNTSSPFTLVADLRQGDMNIDEPEWVHGIAMRAGEHENRTAFHLYLKPLQLLVLSIEYFEFH